MNETASGTSWLADRVASLVPRATTALLPTVTAAACASGVIHYSYTGRPCGGCNCSILIACSYPCSPPGSVCNSYCVQK